MGSELTEPNFNSLFNISKYIFISPLEAGSKAFDLIKFLYDVRDLPEYQTQKYDISQKDFEEIEAMGESIYSTKCVADNFLLFAPILLYRLSESYLKEYLLILYKSDLNKISNYKWQDKKCNYETAIRTSNIEQLKKLYKNSTANVDISSMSGYNIIEEIRELNNCLKHNHDYVNQKLSDKNSFWEIDTIITVKQIKERIQDFDSGINSFFYDLVNQIKPFFK